MNIPLKHAVASELENYVKAAVLWNPTLKDAIRQVVDACQCKLASGPLPHAVVGTSLPPDKAKIISR